MIDIAKEIIRILFVCLLTAAVTIAAAGGFFIGAHLVAGTTPWPTETCQCEPIPTFGIFPYDSGCLPAVPFDRLVALPDGQVVYVPYDTTLCVEPEGVEPTPPEPDDSDDCRPLVPRCPICPRIFQEVDPEA